MKCGVWRGEEREKRCSGRGDCAGGGCGKREGWHLESQAGRRPVRAGWSLGAMDLFSSPSGISPVSVEQNENGSICKVLRGPCQFGSISVLPKLVEGGALPSRNCVAQLSH